MDPGETSFFRGNELSRFVIMLGILIGGGMIVYTFGGSRPEEPGPTPLAELPPMPQPDDSPEFAGVTDKTPLKIRDNAAYVKLLNQVRRTSQASLSKLSRRDVFFTHLAEDPARYRGVPIHIEGTARRVMANEVDAAFSPRRRLFEAWTFTDEAGRYPYQLVFEDPPEGMPGGTNVSLRVSFDGYFLKLLAYKSTRGDYWAPMLIGRISWTPEKTNTPWNRTKEFKYVLYGLVLCMSVLTTYRMTVFVRRSFGGSSAADLARRSLSSTDPEPERLHDWLQKQADREDLDDEDDEA